MATIRYLNSRERRIVRTALLQSADATARAKSAAGDVSPGGIKRDDLVKYYDKLEADERCLADELGDDLAIVSVRK